MKIYFAASIRGGRNDKELYLGIIQVLSKFGTVLTEHIGSQDLTRLGETKDDTYIRLRDIEWITEGNIFVAEVTNPSLGVGYEIREAELQQKSILCLYRQIEGQKVSAMITGSNAVTLKEYQNIADVEDIVRQFIQRVKTA